MVTVAIKGKRFGDLNFKRLSNTVLRVYYEILTRLQLPIFVICVKIATTLKYIHRVNLMINNGFFATLKHTELSRLLVK